MQEPPLITGPIPPFSNPPIQANFYIPNFFFISNITNGQTTLVTTTQDMNYVIGQLCRLLIPGPFGCIELNQQTGYVISLPNTNQVVLSINSNNFSAFTSSNAKTQPQIVAVGDINSGVTNTGRTRNGTLIPGSFQDVSPAPFN